MADVSKSILDPLRARFVEEDVDVHIYVIYYGGRS